MGDGKKIFRAADMERIWYLSSPAISPGGGKYAFAASKGERESGNFISKIMVSQDEKEAETLFSDDSFSYASPRFLTEDLLLCLADVSGRQQVHLCDLKTGELTCLTSARHGVRRYSLSGDGRTIAFELDLWQKEAEEDLAFTLMTPEEERQWAEELEYKPYEITDLTYKMDEWHGMRKGEFAHIAVADLQTGIQTLITKDALESVYPALSSDGKLLAFYGYPYKGAYGRQPELFICDRDGGKRKQLTDQKEVYADTFPAFAEHDREVIYMAFPSLDDGSTVLLPYAAKTEGGSIRKIMDENETQICHGVHPFPANRTEYGEMNPYYQIDERGEYLYFLSSFCGRENIYRKHLYRNEKAQLVLAGKTAVHSFCRSCEGKLLYSMANDRMPAEIFVNANGKNRQLSFCNSWLNEYEIPVTEEFWVPTKDGKDRLQVWLVHPTGGTKERPHPAVLYVRGGPECTYNRDFWHEFLALSGAGFAVIYTNPRGSLGYGREFCSQGIAWRQEAMEDLLTAVDVCVQRGIVDRDRVGITGGSYGGYMTNKLIGRSRRFAAAVTQRSLVNPVTSYGTGDMGFISANPEAGNVKMLDYLTDRARGNAITYIDQMKTPLLILHGFQDYRCSFEQAEQLFIAMKERNPQVPVRLVMFPKANHNLTRTGKLYHQIRHLEEMIRWFQTYLIKEAEH